ncbi:MAG: hypothetical protein HKN48_08600 [Flavobacteriaceae bacterium]|nr:hypothetical protein [Flavobacteriaceae bacterium]
MNTKKKLAKKRALYLEGLPKLKLTKCLVELKDQNERKRFLIKGNPVLVGPLLPEVTIGGLAPLKLILSKDGKTAAGFVDGYFKNEKVSIDYGYTQGECSIDEVAFQLEENRLYNLITAPVKRRKPKKSSFWNRFFK